ncbi:hypothetical protein [Phenylobacterium sp.]|uniref:hypothetical protein n=1 Tax=Phenylobacterium sp. TaxID=1871053 RepID=UPI002DE3585E|nr:hypothetical protein [Phenylobacterium sp.]
MRTSTAFVALFVLGLLTACNQPKARDTAADNSGPLRAPGVAAAPDTLPGAPAQAPISAGLTLRPEFPAFYLDRINEAHDPLKNPATLSGNVPLEMTGFGFDGVAKAPAKGVDLDIDGRLFGTAYGSPRPDVASANKVPALGASGYKAVLPPGALKPGKHQVVVRVVTADGTGYYQSPVINFTVQ